MSIDSKVESQRRSPADGMYHRFGFGLGSGVILLLALITSFYNLRAIDLAQSDDLVYAIYARESPDQWSWWLDGADRTAFEELVTRHNGSFLGGSFKKPLHHMVLTAIASVSADTALGIRVWQAAFRVFVVGALLFFGPRLWGRRIALLAGLFFALNVGSAAGASNEIQVTPHVAAIAVILQSAQQKYIVQAFYDVLFTHQRNVHRRHQRYQATETQAGHHHH